jgi:type I restriction enzyme, R subunit
MSNLGWKTINAYHESYGPGGSLGRENIGEVVLFARLLPALARLNPYSFDEVLRLAAEELARDRGDIYQRKIAQAYNNHFICSRSTAEALW